MSSKVTKLEDVIDSITIKKSEGAPSKPLERMGEELQRPEVLVGATYKIKPPTVNHAMYITINDMVLNSGTKDEQRWPFEIFVNSKNMREFQWVVALTRIVSALFRKGGDITFIAEELRAVFDPSGGYFKKGGVFVPSLVAELGLVLQGHLIHIGLMPEESSPSGKSKSNSGTLNTSAVSASESDFPDGALVCDKCSVKAVVMADGCMTCLNCGFSRCG